MKRVFDIVLAFTALVVLSPVMCVTALAVRLKLGSPILFRQVRPGLHAQAFELIKFRTMLDAMGSDGQPLPDADRLTSFGRSLRSSSLDELPSLFNILRGDMSFVGPRPLRMEYLELYSTEQARRHDVPPGLTGLAQVNGRNAITWEKRLELDVFYVDNKSLWLDIKILFSTVRKVILRNGISNPESVTMPKFLGAKHVD